MQVQTHVTNRRLKSYSVDFGFIVRAFSMSQFAANVLVQIPEAATFFKRVFNSSRISTPILNGTRMNSY